MYYLTSYDVRMRRNRISEFYLPRNFSLNALKDPQANLHMFIDSFQIMPTATPGLFKILYFAAARSFTDKDEETLKAPLKVNELFGILEDRYPGFKKKVLDTCLVTVNLEYVDIGPENLKLESESKDQEKKVYTTIKEGDEVAIIPPVSSG